MNKHGYLQITIYTLEKTKRQLKKMNNPAIRPTLGRRQIAKINKTEHSKLNNLAIQTSPRNMG